MKIYYDPEAQNMLLEGLHKIPKTAIEISQETHDAILSRGVNQQVVVRNRQVFIEDIILTQAELLEQAKQYKTAEIDRARDAELVAGFSYSNYVFDSDEKSIQRITGLVTQTLLNPNFVTPYITKDNQTINLSAQQIRDLGIAASTHESVTVFKARQLKDEAIAAKTVEDVEGIKW